MLSYIYTDRGQATYNGCYDSRYFCMAVTTAGLGCHASIQGVSRLTVSKYEDGSLQLRLKH